ncbi:hypothetical protein D9M69_712210 [compost metagenome]
MNVGENDVVAVAADDDRRCLDLLIPRRDLADIGMKIGDIDGVVAKGKGAQHELRRRLVDVLGGPRIGVEDGTRAAVDPP